MKKFVVALTVLVLPCISFSQDKKWQSLLNENSLTQWDTYIGPLYDSVKKDWGADVIGLNKDPNGVFTIVNMDGKPALRVSGENFGGISTHDEYENYHLRFQFKWGKTKSLPKKNDKRDSGVLYHAVGEHGADYGFWMRSQEFQIQEGDCGDYWGVAGGSVAVKSRKTSSGDLIYDPKGEIKTFNEKSEYGRHCIKFPDAEKPTGEWNTAEIYCFKDMAIHIMNGKVVMVLTSSAQLDGNNIKPLTMGKIQIQSEGSEVFYRDLEVRSITALPKL